MIKGNYSNHTKRIISLAVVLSMTFTTYISFPFHADASATFTAKGKINCKEGAYLRKGAGKDTKAITVLKKGCSITIKGEVFTTSNKASNVYKWYHVTAGKKTGYIRSDLVTITKYNSKKAYATDALNYRIGAGTSMKRSGTLNKNAGFTVVLTAKDKVYKKTWYRIKRGASYYYVCGDWVTFSAPKATAKKTSSTPAKVSPPTNTGSSKNTNTTNSKKDLQSAASKKVASDAADWAIKIAEDNSFHYGNGGHAHHNGCYFCGTQPKSKQKYVIKWEKTYCCNPFVQAAYAHGGKEPTMLKLCQNGGSYIESNYKKSPLFQNLGKPAKSTLIKGDVLCCRNGHVMIYVGNGKLAEAANGDDGKYGSSRWNDSISVSSLNNTRWNNKSYGVCSVFRYIGK